MNNSTQDSSLARYFPKNSLIYVEGFFRIYRFKFRITKKRHTKLGDFKIEKTSSLPTISVNGNLNPYQFLFTFLHEMAHLIVHQKWENKQQPHGKIWKDTFSEILKVGLDLAVFPDELAKAVRKHALYPKASTSADPHLVKALNLYNTQQESLLLEDVPENQVFSLENGRIFIKGKKRRTRFMCVEIDSKKKYLVSGTSHVQLITN